jgi:hypothetical protein
VEIAVIARDRRDPVIKDLHATFGIQKVFLPLAPIGLTFIRVICENQW